MNNQPSRTYTKIALALCLSALAIVSCTKKEAVEKAQESSPAASASEIILGHFASLTGDTASFGLSTRKGVDLAAKIFNAAGGLNGKTVKVITYDDQSKAEEASMMVTKLITEDKVHAVLGEVASKLSIVAADVAQRSKTPMISPSSTNPAVTEKGEIG